MSHQIVDGPGHAPLHMQVHPVDKWPVQGFQRKELENLGMNTIKCAPTHSNLQIVHIRLAIIYVMKL